MFKIYQVSFITKWIFFQISTLLKNSKKIIVITNESIYNFKTASINELPPAFIKELKTTWNKSKELADILPIPNIITGIPAAGNKLISKILLFSKYISTFFF